MFVPANTSWIMVRQRRNAERLCRPRSPGLSILAAYLTLTPTTTIASTARNANRARVGETRSRATNAWGERILNMRRILAAEEGDPSHFDILNPARRFRNW